MAPAFTGGLFVDLDGTVVDSEHHHWRAWRDALSTVGVNLSWREYQTEAIGLSDPEILVKFWSRARFNGRNTEPARILSAKQQHFIKLVQEDNPVLHTTRRVIRHLSRFPLALVTSSCRLEALAVLQGAEIETYFHTIVCLDDVQHPKPAPDPYLIAMERLHVKAGIAFEDSRAGQASARAAGLEVIPVRTPDEFPELVSLRLRTALIADAVPLPRCAKGGEALAPYA